MNATTVLRHIGLIIVLWALNLILFSSMATGAGFTVDSTVDATDINPGDGICADVSGKCTLRAAIQETNELHGVNTIVLPSGFYKLEIVSDQSFPSILPEITNDLTIAGAGAAATIVDGNALGAIFQVGTEIFPQPNPTVSISSVTIQNGSGFYGGIFVGSGSLNLRDSIIKGSSTNGIYNRGLLEISRCTINNNDIGIITYDPVKITNSMISNNSSFGILMDSGLGSANLIVSDSTIKDNSIGIGQGPFNLGGIVNIKNCAIINNSILLLGDLESAEITNSTICSNLSGVGIE